MFGLGALTASSVIIVVLAIFLLFFARKIKRKDAQKAKVWRLDAAHTMVKRDKAIFAAHDLSFDLVFDKFEFPTADREAIWGLRLHRDKQIENVYRSMLAEDSDD